MNYTQATKEQLLTIALHEPCELADKYEAVKELENRKDLGGENYE